MSPPTPTRFSEVASAQHCSDLDDIEIVRDDDRMPDLYTASDQSVNAANEDHPANPSSKHEVVESTNYTKSHASPSHDMSTSPLPALQLEQAEAVESADTQNPATATQDPSPPTRYRHRRRGAVSLADCALPSNMLNTLQSQRSPTLFSPPPRATITTSTGINSWRSVGNHFHALIARHDPSAGALPNTSPLFLPHSIHKRVNLSAFIAILGADDNHRLQEVSYTEEDNMAFGVVLNPRSELAGRRVGTFAMDVLSQDLFFGAEAGCARFLLYYREAGASHPELEETEAETVSTRVNRVSFFEQVQVKYIEASKESADELDETF